MHFFFHDLNITRNFNEIEKRIDKMRLEIFSDIMLSKNKIIFF